MPRKLDVDMHNRLTKALAERDRLAKTLAESESRLHSLFSSSPDAAWILENHRFVESNQAAVALFGFASTTDFLNRHPSDVSPMFQPDGEESLAKAERMMCIADARGIHRFEWVHVRKDGSEFVAEVTLGKFTIAGKSAIHAVVRDITGLKQTERQLAEERQRFKDFSESTADWFWEMNADLRFSYFSDNFEKVYGLNQEAVLGRTRAELLARDRLNPKHLVDAHIAQVEQHQPFRDFEYRIRDIAGNIRWISISGLPVLGPGSNFLGYRGVGRIVTERKQVEAALKVSEERYKAIIDTSHIPSAVNDDNGSIIYLNPAFTTAFGYAHRDIPTLEAWWPRAYPDPDYQQWVKRTWLERLVQAHRTGEPFDPMEVRIRTKSGEVRTVMASAAPLNSGEDHLHLVTLFDITDRIEAEQQRQQMTDLLQLALDSAQMGIWELDIETGRLYWSPEVYKHFSVEAGEPDVEYFLARMVHPDDVAQLKAAMDRAIEERSTFFAEFRVISSGAVRWLEDRARVICDPQGRPVRVVGTVIDITDRKRTEDELYSSKQHLELALAGAELGMWHWAISTDELSFNTRTWEMLGYQSGDVKTRIANWEQRLHPEDLSVFRAALTAHVNGETPGYQAELRVRHKNGHWVWILDRGKVVIRDDEGAPVLAAGTHLDISDRKQLKQEGTELLRKIEGMILRLNDQPGAPSGRVDSAQRNSDAKPKLTRRQQDVLKLIATGMTSARIAQHLNISRETVIGHRRELMRRLGVHSIASLTRYAIEHRLIDT